MKAKAGPANKNTAFDIIRGTLVSLIASVLFVLVLALIVKLTGLSDGIILPISQVIKIISILIGCLVGIKEKAGGAFKGAVIGILYAIISVFIFLILYKSISANSFSVIDMTASVLAGAVSGIIAVNFKRK